MNETCNEVNLSGKIIKVYPTKLTLSNVPIFNFVLEHTSKQSEHNIMREVKCKLYCIRVGDLQFKCDELLNQDVLISGFLAQNMKTQLVLHVSNLNILNKGI